MRTNGRLASSKFRDAKDNGRRMLNYTGLVMFETHVKSKSNIVKKGKLNAEEGQEAEQKAPQCKDYGQKKKVITAPRKRHALVPSF